MEQGYSSLAFLQGTQPLQLCQQPGMSLPNSIPAEAGEHEALVLQQQRGERGSGIPSTLGLTGIGSSAPKLKQSTSRGYSSTLGCQRSLFSLWQSTLHLQNTPLGLAMGGIDPAFGWQAKGIERTGNAPGNSQKARKSRDNPKQHVWKRVFGMLAGIGLRFGSWSQWSLDEKLLSAETRPQCQAAGTEGRRERFLLD